MIEQEHQFIYDILMFYSINHFKLSQASHPKLLCVTESTMTTSLIQILDMYQIKFYLIDDKAYLGLDADLKREHKP